MAGANPSPSGPGRRAGLGVLVLEATPCSPCATVRSAEQVGRLSLRKVPPPEVVLSRKVRPPHRLDEVPVLVLQLHLDGRRILVHHHRLRRRGEHRLSGTAGLTVSCCDFWNVAAATFEVGVPARSPRTRSWPAGAEATTRLGWPAGWPLSLRKVPCSEVLLEVRTTPPGPPRRRCHVDPATSTAIGADGWPAVGVCGAVVKTTASGRRRNDRLLLRGRGSRHCRPSGSAGRPGVLVTGSCGRFALGNGRGRWSGTCRQARSCPG